MNNQTKNVNPSIKITQIKPQLKISTNQNLKEKNNQEKKIQKDPSYTKKGIHIFSQTFSNRIRNPNINSQKNFKTENINSGINVNIILSVTQRENQKINNLEEEQKIPKISPYNFKYFCNTANKKSISKALSADNPNKNEKRVMESNFIKLTKDANIYTANANYITNKKLLLFDKYNYENNNYRPNRANLFDMTSIPHSKTKNNTVYKTTRFRGGRMFFYDNKNTALINDMKTNNNVLIKKKPLYMQELEKFELKTENKYLDKIRDIKFVDNSFQTHKRHPPSNSLYKELMTKKNEIYDNFINNKISEVEKKSYPLFNSNSTSYIIQNLSEDKENGKEKQTNKKYIKNEDLNGYSNLLYKKKDDGVIPITFPLICSNAEDCDSISQRKRYEIIMDTFIRLKILIEMDKKLGKNNEKDYIIELILNKKLDKKYIQYEYIDNFINFLNCKKLPIDTNKTLKENIILALNYKKPEKHYILDENKNNKDNTKNKDKNEKEEKIFEIYPLEYDLKRQTKLYSKENYRNNYELRDALKKEINSIDEEVKNKQIKIRQIEDNLNLLPFEANYYYKKKFNKKLKLNKNQNKELLLISHQGYYKAIIPFYDKNKKEIKRNKTNDALFNSNERLYYTWYKNKNIGDIKNYMKKSKLTKYI